MLQGLTGCGLFRERLRSAIDLSFVSGNCEALGSESVQEVSQVFPLYQVSAALCGACGCGLFLKRGGDVWEAYGCSLFQKRLRGAADFSLVSRNVSSRSGSV